VKEPLISVVIPTFRRHELVQRAVQSVLRQTYTSVEVIVVIDGVDDGTRARIDHLRDARTRVLETGHNQGPAEARNHGVRRAVGDYVALLDDDDEWTEQKLERQIHLVERLGLAGREFLISCRVIGRTPEGTYVWPEHLFQAGGDLSEYLLDRRSPFSRPGMVCSGTLLFPRSLALRVPFAPDTVHEDWSWLLLCVVRDRTPLVMCEEPMFIYHLDPESVSLNKQANWRSSLEWGRRYRAQMSGVAFAGLLATTTAWRAKRQGSWRDFMEIARAMDREGDANALHWQMLISVMLLPPEIAEKLRRCFFGLGRYKSQLTGLLANRPSPRQQLGACAGSSEPASHPLADHLDRRLKARPLHLLRGELEAKAIMKFIPSMPSLVSAGWFHSRSRRLAAESLSYSRNRRGPLADYQASTNAEISIRPPLVAVPERPRQVLLWHWGRAGAGAKFTLELARELRNAPGFRLTVSASAGSQLAMLADSDKNIVLRTVRTFEGNKASWTGKVSAASGLLGLWQLARDFRRILNERQTDIAICAFQSIWDLAAIPTLRRHANRFILILHDAKLHPGDYYPFRESVLRWEVATADALIVLSDHVGRAAQLLYEFPPDRIWTVPHGTLSFGAGTVTPRTFPHNRPMRLLFFGRILKYKGLGHLLDAYRLLRERGAAVELDIVGSGDLAPYKSQLAGLPDVSINNAWVNEEQIAQALARADIMMLPYIEASQSGVAAAALTAGLPIVATPVGGLVEQVRCGQTGIIAKGIGPEDLAAAIQSLIDDPSLYETCSAGALRHAQEELGWARIATEIGAIVKEVASRPSRRGHR
jgi:glycosyltransferase involved in cell wall biosynthesis